jgi:hypothetical protein
VNASLARNRARAISLRAVRPLAHRAGEGTTRHQQSLLKNQSSWGACPRSSSTLTPSAADRNKHIKGVRAVTRLCVLNCSMCGLVTSA